MKSFSSNLVAAPDAIALVIATNVAYVEGLNIEQEELDDFTAHYVFRACHYPLEARHEDTTINIIEHHAKKVAWYYGIAAKSVYDVNDIKDTDMRKMDMAMGLRGPSYGELVWYETKGLTPSITHQLSSIYQVANYIREHAHELYKTMPLEHARRSLRCLIENVNKLQ